jgi:hypothetical protein
MYTLIAPGASRVSTEALIGGSVSSAIISKPIFCWEFCGTDDGGRWNSPHFQTD